MDQKDELERLRQHAQSLERSVEGIDQELDRAMQELASRDDTGRLVAFIRDRYNVQLGLTYDLGKVEAQAERWDNLIREAEEQPQERLATERWQKHQPLAREDHLDWFKESLAESPLQVEAFERAEQRMLEEMKRQPSDDQLDWFSGRA